MGEWDDGQQLLWIIHPMPHVQHQEVKPLCLWTYLPNISNLFPQFLSQLFPKKNPIFPKLPDFQFRIKSLPQHCSRCLGEQPDLPRDAAPRGRGGGGSSGRKPAELHGFLHATWTQQRGQAGDVGLKIAANISKLRWCRSGMYRWCIDRDSLEDVGIDDWSFGLFDFDLYLQQLRPTS